MQEEQFTILLLVLEAVSRGDRSKRTFNVLDDLCRQSIASITPVGNNDCLRLYSQPAVISTDSEENPPGQLQFPASSRDNVMIS